MSVHMHYMDDWTVPGRVYVCTQQCPHINSVCIVLGSQVYMPVSAYIRRWYAHLLSARLSSSRDMACRMIYQTVLRALCCVTIFILNPLYAY